MKDKDKISTQEPRSKTQEEHDEQVKKGQTSRDIFFERQSTGHDKSAKSISSFPWIIAACFAAPMEIASSGLTCDKISALGNFSANNWRIFGILVEPPTNTT